MYHPFSVPDTLKTAWYLLKRNFPVIAIYTLIGFVTIGAFGTIFFFLNNDLTFSIGVIVLLLLISFIFLGFIKLIFQLIDREYYDFEFGDIVPKFKMMYSYLLLLIIVDSISFFLSHAIKTLDDGWMKYILGIAVGGFFQFFFLFYFPVCACFIVDDSSGPFESVAQSFRIIRGNFLKYLLLFVFIEGIAFLGLLTIVGMVFVIPFVNIILVVAYRKLIYSRQDIDDDLAETK
jgi:hypothetical protein